MAELRFGLPCPYSEPYIIIAWCLVFLGASLQPGKRDTDHVSPMHLLGLSGWGYHGRHGRYMAGEIARLGRCSQIRRPREITRGPFLRGHRISFWTQVDPLHWVCQLPLYCPLLFGLPLGSRGSGEDVPLSFTPLHSDQDAVFCLFVCGFFFFF